jgi:predicted nucleotidyltransferase
MDIEEIKSKILPVLRAYGAYRAGLFGSAARGEMREESDVDILVGVRKDMSLLGFIKLKQELEEKLGRNVDLVEYEAIKPSLRERILSDHLAVL